MWIDYDRPTANDMVKFTKIGDNVLVLGIILCTFATVKFVKICDNFLVSRCCLCIFVFIKSLETSSNQYSLILYISFRCFIFNCFWNTFTFYNNWQNTINIYS